MVQRELLNGARPHDHSHRRGLESSMIVVVTVQPGVSGAGLPYPQTATGPHAAPLPLDAHPFARHSATTRDTAEPVTLKDPHGKRLEPHITREIEPRSSHPKEAQDQAATSESPRRDPRESKPDDGKTQVDRRVAIVIEEPPEARTPSAAIERGPHSSPNEIKPREPDIARPTDSRQLAEKPEVGPAPPATSASPKPTPEAPRNDSVTLTQLAQQVEASIRQNLAPTPTVSSLEPNPSLGATPHVYLQSHTELRTSVLDKLTQLQDGLDIAMARAAQPGLRDERGPTTDLAAKPEQGSFIYFERPSSSVESSLAPQRADRNATPSSPQQRPELIPDTVPQESASPNSHKLLRSLARLAEKALSVETLRKLDRGFENACLTLFGAAALGVIATDRILRALIALGRYSQQAAQDEDAVSDGEAILLHGVSEALYALEVELLEKNSGSASTLVADVTGVVGLDGAARPIEGVRIEGGPLGTTHTDTWGQFTFKNIPLGEAFHLSLSHPEYFFNASTVTGIAGINTFINVTATTRQKFS